MGAVIYFLYLIVIVGLFVTFFRFFKFFASFLSLISTTMETGREMPRKNALTGGLGPMWRVLRHKGNAHAGKVLVRNMALFFGSFAVTLGAALLMIDLNAVYCVLDMTHTSLEGTVIAICNSSE